MVPYLLFGAGFAAITPSLATMAMAAVEPGRSGLAAGIVNAARQMDPDSVPVEQRKAVTGKYVMHCHNLVHEDHDMMTQFQTQPDPAAVASKSAVVAAAMPGICHLVIIPRVSLSSGWIVAMASRSSTTGFARLGL